MNHQTCHDDASYARSVLLSVRAAISRDDNGEPVIRLAHVPQEMWQRYEPKALRSKSRGHSVSNAKLSENAGHRQANSIGTEITEVIRMEGDPEVQDIMRASLEVNKKDIESMGATVSEKKGIRSRRHIVITGPHAAVEKVLPVLESLMQNAKDAKAKVAAPVPSLQEADEEDSRKKAAGETLLKMLKRTVEPPATAPSEQQPLSRDELLLCAMEAREDATIGADAMNEETFGEVGGWSHEENVVANQALNFPSQAAPSEDAMEETDVHTDSRLQTIHTSAQLPNIQAAPASRPPPPPVPVWAQPQFQKQVQAKQISSPQNTDASEDTRPFLQVSHRSKVSSWVCPVCTLHNPMPATKCAACQGSRALDSELVFAKKPLISSPVAPLSRQAITKSSKPSKREEPLDPLPHRHATRRAPPRMLSAGLVVAQGPSANAASGPKWAERPVEKLVPGRSWEAEDEDPELACYMWSSQLNRPKIDRHQRASVKWGLVN
jgi:hypothetical protein